MTFSTLILLVSGRKVSIKDRIIIQQGFHHGSSKNIKSLIKNIFIYALFLEVIGAFFFFLHWHGKFETLKALFLSVFHAISAFCNAGFSLFSNSFESFRSDVRINILLMVLIVLGGMGFFVLQDIRDFLKAAVRRKKYKISLHTKIVLVMTLILIGGGCLLILIMEWNGALSGFSLKDKIMASLFQSITPRTAGFNTLNIATMGHAAVFLLIMLMFVGASPGSTGGGVKTSTIGVIFAFLKSKIMARDSVNFFYRTFPPEIITKAFTVVTLGIIVISFSTFMLFLVQPEAGMKDIFFEVFSAFGTVGLSMGLTSQLTTIGKIVIIMTMYIGRIGPLTLLFAFSREKAFGKFEYVEETVMIG